MKFSIETITPLLKECGRIVLSMRRPAQELKADQTVVTAADQAVEAFLARHFDRPRQGSFLIGEETVSSKPESYLKKALQAPECWIVDPIDGTAPFTAGLPVWGISIARMTCGRITDGAIYLAGTDTAYLTEGGTILKARLRHGGKWHRFTPIPHPLDASGHVSVGQKMLKQCRITFPNQVFGWSTCVGSTAAVLEGKLLGYVADVKLWDIAACIALLERSGMVIEKRSRKRVSVDLSDGSFALAPGKNRWALIDGAAIAPDGATARYLWDHLELL